MSNKNSTTELLIDYYSTNSAIDELKVAIVGSPQFITKCLTELLQHNHQIALNGIYTENSELPDETVMDTCDLVLIEQHFTISQSFIHQRFKHKVFFIDHIASENALQLKLSGTTNFTGQAIALSDQKVILTETSGTSNSRIEIDPFFSLKYGLSKREAHTLYYLINGYSYKMIASEMFISIDTVRSHIKRIYRKLGINCVAQAIVKVLQKAQHEIN